MHHLPLALPTGPECAPANRRAAKASTKAAGVKTVSTKAATSVETTAVEAVEAVEAAEAAMETAEAAMAAPAAPAATATAATARRYNVGCKHSKCCSRQQRDCDFTEHDQPSLVQEDDAQFTVRSKSLQATRSIRTSLPIRFTYFWVMGNLNSGGAGTKRGGPVLRPRPPWLGSRKFPGVLN
jgi:hypothetical protein